jgi:gliding motility-associated-like protein
MGTEFWTAYMLHIRGTTGNERSTMQLYITSNVNTSGKVEMADGTLVQDFQVQANQVTIVVIPASAYIDSQGEYLRGIHITSIRPVAVYAHIFAFSVSGATLLLPVNTLGKDYVSINYKQTSNADNSQSEPPSYSTLAVIGTEDNTQVNITPYNDGKPSGPAYTITLSKGEVYQTYSAKDLTGTRVQSVSTNDQECKKIAVFSGSSKIQITCNPDYKTSDNLFQQVYPTATWGKNYITVPLKNRSYDVFRVILSDPDTEVKVNGVVTPVVAGTNFIQFESNKPNEITADKPVQAVQYAVSENQGIGCTFAPNDMGDPEMIYLNPLEQNLDKVTLFSSRFSVILAHYVNVVIKTSAVSTFRLDGVAYNQFTAMPGTAYSYAQIPVSEGTHNIKAAEGFNAIAYGFGQRESYGYAAGASLKNLDKNIVLNEPASGKFFTDGCINTTYKLRLLLPYKTTSIEWKSSDGKVAAIDNNPQFTTIVQNGKTLYAYQYAQTVTYPLPGDYNVTATVVNPAGGDCGAKEDIDLDFAITGVPVAAFTATNQCFGQLTRFVDASNAMGSTVKSWTWNFGDGTPEITTNVDAVEHQYLQYGTWNVTLTITTASGCTANIPQQVKIFETPVVNFTPPAILCVGAKISFTGTSPQAANIKTWTWTFDDNTPPVTGKDAEHIFAQAGTYQVKLVTESLDGCFSEITHPVIINPVPVVDFDMTEVCVNDEYAEFTDKSTISDNTEGEFTYQWNFGDNVSSGPGNPNTATGKVNIRHRYTQAGIYTVTLTVISKYGCPIVLTRDLTVSGDQFAGDIEVEDKDKLCSNREVVFKNNVTVNGNISKVEWYFDVAGNPQEKQTYTKADIPADGRFTHLYPVFNTATPKNYQVKMVIYSGKECSATRIIAGGITLNAAPLIGLPNKGSVVCENDTPIALGEEKNGFAGTGLFSGDGVSSNTFNPTVAGPGEHQISYTFTSPTTGCTFDDSFKITVNPVSKITVKAKYTIFEGEAITLAATATGSNLSYRWSPVGGLNKFNVLQPTANPVEDTRYKLEVTTTTNCTTIAYIDVVVLRKLTIPNTFTPNDDGVNDNWTIAHIEDYPNCTVNIFNRYGEKLYTSTGYNIPWNGTYKGSKLVSGTYYYVIDLKDGRKPIAGYMTILK